ncbi:MAG: NAD(P)-dependent alcohol dehydrogenase [Candidatus Heimdallarchaeota archaeon]
MKAIICPKYGPPEVLKLEEVEKPEPKDDEVLIRNYGTSINTVDVSFRSGKAPKAVHWILKPIVRIFLRKTFGGFRKPKEKIPGSGFAGEIEEIGKDVSSWKVGDQVYGYSDPFGACAEYLVAHTSILAKKPTNLSFQEAAAVPGGASPALVAFRDMARPKKDDKVLVIGASGGIGTFAVQIAKMYGAEVTGVCGTSNLAMVKGIGADFAIDYTKEDYTENEKTYDIIFDAIGVSTFTNCEKILTDTGVYVSNNIANNPSNMFKAGNKNLENKFKSVNADESAEVLNLLREWIESGKIKPVIDTVYPLSQLAKAHRHYETGHAKGRIVIEI